MYNEMAFFLSSHNNTCMVKRQLAHVEHMLARVSNIGTLGLGREAMTVHIVALSNHNMHLSK